MVRGSVSRSVFLNTRYKQNLHTVPIIVPNQPFSAMHGERHALTLAQFGMQSNFPMINNSNNMMYIYYRANSTTYTKFQGSFHKFPLPHGTYANVESFIQACTKLYAEQTFEFLDTITFSVSGSGYIQITLTLKDEADFVDLFTFHIRNAEFDEEVPSGVDVPFGTYSDSYLILGSNPATSLSSDNYDATEVNCFKRETDSTDAAIRRFEGLYPLQLSSLDAIYIRMHSLELGNWSTPNLTDNAQRTGRIIESQIFARIPLQPNYRVAFTDNGNDQFQVFIKRSQIESLDVQLCDAAGRDLFDVFKSQAQHGQFGAQMVFRYDTFENKNRHPEEKQMRKDTAQPPLFVMEH